MARLSAHGFEVARLVKNFACDPQYYVAQRRVYLSFRSDRYVLKKAISIFKDASLGSSSGSWKIAGRVEASMGTDLAIKMYEELGYKRL